MDGVWNTVAALVGVVVVTVVLAGFVVGSLLRWVAAWRRQRRVRARAR